MTEGLQISISGSLPDYDEGLILAMVCIVSEICQHGKREPAVGVMIPMAAAAFISAAHLKKGIRKEEYIDVLSDALADAIGIADDILKRMEGSHEQ